MTKISEIRIRIMLENLKLLVYTYWENKLMDRESLVALGSWRRRWTYLLGFLHAWLIITEEKLYSIQNYSISTHMIADNLSKKRLKSSSRPTTLTLAYFGSTPKHLPPFTIILCVLKSISASIDPLLCNHAKAVARRIINNHTSCY